ncbi:MAG TPA: thioredoxin domain-containing protein [Gemmatimonadaceae bacterium]|nr:thioredoxin domain-containing protein [Gemmatimonadaceae bacterium]
MIALRLAAIAALAAVAACGASAAEGGRADASAAAPDTAAIGRADRARIQGRADAPIYVVEVSDFQCPYCKVWHDSTYPAVVAEYVRTGRARLAYVHMPLGSHPNAQPAAEASMCAGAQDKFWPMHDRIFDTQARWAALADPGPAFDSLAAGIGVDMAAWRRCMTSRQMEPSVRADYERAIGAGVNSTPSFFVGGRLVSGAVPLADFRRLIEAAGGAAKRGAGQ